MTTYEQIYELPPALLRVWVKHHRAEAEAVASAGYTAWLTSLPRERRAVTPWWDELNAVTRDAWLRAATEVTPRAIRARRYEWLFITPWDELSTDEQHRWEMIADEMALARQAIRAEKTASRVIGTVG